jgi:conjugative transfer signal peptidase TraF
VERTFKTRGGIGILGLAGLSIVLLGLAAFSSKTPRLVWNASASAPRGLYLIAPDAVIERGDLILATLPDALRRFAAARGYLPDGVPILKRIVASTGAEICTTEAGLSVEGRIIPRLAADRAGRPMPLWLDCRTLGTDEVFLLMADIPDSFDSRYFGPVSVRQIIGKATPLWTE